MGRDRNERGSVSGLRVSRRDVKFDGVLVLNYARFLADDAKKRAANYVRVIARRSLKKPRRKSLAEMPPVERQAFLAKQRAARRKGLPAPKRPFANAKPGKPPYNDNDIIRRLLEFGETPNGDFVIGPRIFKRGTVSLLEHGGKARLPGYGGEPVEMEFRGNPFMRPALEAAAPKIPDLFR